MDRKGAVNPRMLAAARMRTIFGLRRVHQLTQAEYQDYLSWVHIMVHVERQRVAQRSSRASLLPVTDAEQAVPPEAEALA